MKKFELTSETTIHNGITLYRIRALKSYPFVKEKVKEKNDDKRFENRISIEAVLRSTIKSTYTPQKGDLGGFVQSEKNLSQQGNCWVADNAKVYNNAKISGNAEVLDNAEVFDNSEISGNVSIGGITEICGNTKLNETYRYSSRYLIYNNIKIFGDSFLLDIPINQFNKNYSVSLVSGGAFSDIDTPHDPEIECYGMYNLNLVVNTLDSDGWERLIIYRKKTKTIRAGKFEGTVKDFINFYNHRCKYKDDLDTVVKFLKNPISRKYRLTTENKEIHNVKLFRIKALRSFSDIKKGSLGGFIEKEDNLSHIENCWISDDAVVSGNARIYGDARVYQKAFIHDNAQVCDEAEVFGYSNVHGNAKIFINAKVFGRAKIYGNAQIYGDANIYGDAIIFDNAKVHFNARIMSNTKVFGNASLTHDTYTKTNQYITLGPINDYLNDFGYITFEKQSKIINVHNFPHTIDEFKERYSKRGKENNDFQLIMEFLKVLESFIRQKET